MKCKSCDGENLFEAFKLKDMPPPGHFLKDLNQTEYSYPVKMLICSQCGLGQLSYDVAREDLFDYYTFKTSVSKSFVKHSVEYVNENINKIKSSDWVLEIASNDGYMLKEFINRGVDVLGIEPAKNITLYASVDGVPTYNGYFDKDLAKQIFDLKGFPRLIIANNVFAHVPNIKDFAEGLAVLCGPKTEISIENPTIMNILLEQHFDTIYHEHYSYLSVNAVSQLFDICGLSLFDVEQISTQNGSNRYWVKKDGVLSERGLFIKEEEVKAGLFDKNAWQNSYNIVINKLKKFKNSIDEINSSGGRVCGYTASSKANTVLLSAGVDEGSILCIADDASEKQNKFTPKIHIPVVSFEKMLDLNPTHIVIFAHNIYNEINNKIKLSSSNAWVVNWYDL